MNNIGLNDTELVNNVVANFSRLKQTVDQTVHQTSTKGFAIFQELEQMKIILESRPDLFGEKSHEDIGLLKMHLASEIQRVYTDLLSQIQVDEYLPE